MMKQYSVTGMSCAACSARVEKAVSVLDGVESCSVNLLTNSMSVEGNIESEKIIQAVVNAGYDAKLKNGSKESKKSNEIKTSVLKLRLFSSIIFLIALMYLSMGHTMWNFPVFDFIADNPMNNGMLQMLLTISIMVINQKFFISGIKGVINKAPNMDTLVSLGSFASFSYSVYILFIMSGAMLKGESGFHYLHDLYFESAGTILTLITVGKMLESKAKGKTTTALEGLMKLAPKTATVIREGKEIVVSVDDVRISDIFIVKPGEQIPVDGIVVEGHSAVNESALTGESIPADKEIGDYVSSGTMNENGYLKCEAKKVGEDTTLSKIIQMVSDAAATKAPIAKIADKVSGIFVPVVLVISLITLIIWLLLGETFGFAIARAISVLVISCPCALGLATPVAVMVGTGVGAKNGVLFKTAIALEQTGKAKTVVLDKTGTITEGNPKVVGIYPSGGIDEKNLLKIAASLEKNSEHPLAKAVLKKAEEENVKAVSVSDFFVAVGGGLGAKIDNEMLYGGNLKFIETKTEIQDETKELANMLSQDGKTPLFFAKENLLLGIIAVSDVVKKDSSDAISKLKKMGIRVVMLTGDNQKTAKAIGKQVGADEIIAGVLPDEKESVIRHLQENSAVIMVGDGINDAPALTRADVGIAIGAGTDIAIDAADVILVKNSLMDVYKAIKISKHTFRNIKENLFWAFIYNTVGIPLAAGVFWTALGLKLNPMFGAFAMSISSFCVVCNALRLNFIKLKENKKGEVRKMEKLMRIEGMMCPHCEARVKKCLEEISGVKEADVSHETGSALVKLNEDIADEILKNIVEAQGYSVTEIK